VGVFFPAGDWFRAFVLTVVVEIPVATYLLRRAEPQLWRTAALVFFANLASHPLVWYVWTQVFLVGSLPYVLAAEAWAVIVEAAFYFVAFRGIGIGRATLVSVVANLASFAVGRLVIQFWPEVLR
jgi:hypothetical protein